MSLYLGKRHFTHPECKTGEIFLGNTTKQMFHQFEYDQKRLGHKAYGINDNLLPPSEGLYPLFVSLSEFNEKRGVSNNDSQNKGW
ncbi:MAG: hypothetical protein VX730_07080 [Pseudomonadota bacterium]|nr:hypothetical protein [Pseudomonadota bacterium]